MQKNMRVACVFCDYHEHVKSGAKTKTQAALELFDALAQVDGVAQWVDDKDGSLRLSLFRNTDGNAHDVVQLVLTD